MAPEKSQDKSKQGDKIIASKAHASRKATRGFQRQPLSPLSHNVSRHSDNHRGSRDGTKVENDKAMTQDTIVSTTKGLENMQIKNKEQEKGQVATRPGSERARAGTGTRTGGSQKPLALERGFKKVRIAGKFTLKSVPVIRRTHMASSSRDPGEQMSAAQLEADAYRINPHTFRKAPLHGDLHFHLFVDIAFGANKDLKYSAVFDTGGTDIHVDGRAFKPGDAKNDKDELNNSKLGEDKYALTRYPGFEDLGAVKGLLHKCTVTLGDTLVKDQHFYVDEKAPFQLSVGVGPPTENGHVGHSSKDAPTIITNIAKQYGLEKIMGVNVKPWNETVNEGEEDTLKGSSVHLGGIDNKCFANSSLRYFSNSTQEEHWGIEVDRVTYTKNNREREKVDLLQDEAVVGILDCGAPFLFFNEDMCNKYMDCLEESGVHGFYEKGDRCPTISKDSFPNLRPLTFHLFDEDNFPYTVEIPPDGQVLPPALGNLHSIPQDRLALAIGIAPAAYDIVLGIPFFQRRYVLFDLTVSPYRIGLAETAHTGYLSPALKEILDKAQSREQQADGKRKSPEEHNNASQRSRSSNHRKRR